MFSDSRKAQHNSFAHHRADLLFAKPTATNGLRKDAARQQKIQDGIDGGAAFKLRVRAGLLGFAPAAQAL
jgi:hypothetical protein